MAYEWQSDIIRPDGENGTEILDGQGVYQPQLEGGDNITIENGRINASGTLENIQADYTETDSASPSYIKHKPDLSIYATASGMETELSGKQDVISDLATIRSGAEAGSTAVQPGDLAAVAKTGAYSDLSGTPTIPTVDQTYNAASTNAQSGVAVAEAIAAIPTPSVDEVPDVGSTDDGKVLTASYSGGVGSYSWESSQGGGSYTATAPIAIESDVIKLKYDGNFTTAYQFDVSAITGYEQTNSYGMCSALTFPTLSQYYAGGRFCLIFDTKVIPNYYYVSISGQGMSSSTGWTIIAYKQGSETTDYVYATEVYDYDAASSSSSNKVIVGHGQDVKYYTFTFNQNNVHGNLSNTPLCFAIVPNPAESISGSSPWGTPYFQARGGSLSSYLTQVVKTNTNPSAQNVPTGTGTIVADTLTLSSVVRTLPEYSQSDVNKVLKVNASGNTEWKYDDNTTYTAGNMISIDANYYNAIGVSTTAGITDIQVVNELPASPVATVLYLIPEA